jgi:hypothetical protein
VVPGWIYKKFQVEKKEDDFITSVRGNARLFQLFDELRDRQRRLSTILSRGLVQDDPSVPLLFGGCYISGTGTDATREQAFVAGVFYRLIEGQSCVYWTEETRAEEATYQRWISFGWTVLILLALASIGMVGYWIYKNQGR